MLRYEAEDIPQLKNGWGTYLVLSKLSAKDINSVAKCQQLQPLHQFKNICYTKLETKSNKKMTYNKDKTFHVPCS